MAISLRSVSTTAVGQVLQALKEVAHWKLAGREAESRHPSALEVIYCHQSPTCKPLQP